MKKRLAFMAAVLAVASTMLLPSARAGVTGVRVALTDGAGNAITCGSTLSGVGEIIANDFATANAAAPVGQFKTSYDANGSGGGDWYMQFKAQPLASSEVQMAQVVQDLSPAQNGSSVTFGFSQPANVQTSCTVTVTNIPAPNGTLSTRNAITGNMQSMRVEMHNYADGRIFSCNTNSPGGRINPFLFADANTGAAGLYDLHVHEERGVSNLGTGPDQDMNTANARWWEAALFRVRVETSEMKVASLVSQLTDHDDKMVHWGQQALGEGGNDIADATEQMCDYD